MNVPSRWLTVLARTTVTRRIDTRASKAALMLAAFLATIVLAYYQRRTGPSWPVSVTEQLAGRSVTGRLPRSHAGAGNAMVSLKAPPEVTGELLWRRFPTDDPWNHVLLERLDGELRTALPHQPPAGKVEYSLRLHSEGKTLVIPPGGTVILRFRGDVPPWILIPHILLMFFALMAGLRAGLGAVLGESRSGRFVPWVLALVIPGGLIFGPLVQKLAFGSFWTGWPFGEDWTDTKTLASVLIWILAAVVGRRGGKEERLTVLAAALVMLAVYLIPHSANGSQLDWEEVEKGTADAPAWVFPDAGLQCRSLPLERRLLAPTAFPRLAGPPALSWPEGGGAIG